MTSFEENGDPERPALPLTAEPTPTGELRS